MRSVCEKEQRNTWREDEWVWARSRDMNGGSEGKAGERQMEVSRSVRSWHVMGHAQV